MGQRMAGHVEVFQAAVEHGRIAARVVDDGKYLFQIREEVRFRFAFPGIEPVDIALNGIDLPRCGRYSGSDALWPNWGRYWC